MYYRNPKLLYIFISSFALFLLSGALFGQNNETLESIRKFNLGSKDDSKEFLLNLEKEGRASDLSFYYLSSIYMRGGDTLNALNYIKKAVDADSSNYWYNLQYARLLSISGDYNSSALLYESLRRKFPKKISLFDDMVDVYIRQNNFTKALEIIGEIERLYGVNEGTALTRFNILSYEGKREEAIAVLKDYNDQGGTPRSSTILGDYYANNQSDSLALSYYKKALSMDPTYIPACFGMAETYRIAGNYEEYFQKMIPFLSNSSVQASMKTGYMKEILSNAGFVKQFMPRIDTMMANMYNAHVADSSVAYMYMAYLVQTGKESPALDVLKRNLDYYPNQAEPYRQYLSLVYYLKKWELLDSEATKALELFPGEVAFYELRGIALLQKGEPLAAIEIYKELLKQSKNDKATTVRALSVLGDLYYEAGKRRESYKYYDKTLKADPNHIPTLNNYAYYLSLENKSLNKAYKMSKKTIDAEPDNPTYLDTFGWILYKMGKYLEAKGIFKHAMIYGGKDNADLLDHYAEVLYALGEYDLAFIYWDQAKALDSQLGIEDKIALRKQQMKK